MSDKEPVLFEVLGRLQIEPTRAMELFCFQIRFES